MRFFHRRDRLSSANLRSLNKTQNNGTARTVGNLYDANGNRIRVTYPDGAYFTYDLDGLDRPIRVLENGTDPITVFAYDWAGRRAWGAWYRTSYAYDAAGRLQTLSHNPEGTAYDHTLGFAYNPASQIVTRTASNDSYAWTGAVSASRPYAANGLNQYTSAGAATFTHDANGNLASTANAPWSTSYVYDVENRLVSATGTHNATLTYDPLGRLWQVSSGAGIRRLVYDGDALIAEYDAAGTMPHRYIHGNDPGVDDPLVWYANATYGWRQLLFHDHQGSIVGVTDMYANSIARNSYDPWGIPGPNNLGRFGYTGQTWVPELGLWYYKARFYSPTTGRFLQVDPIGYDGGKNLYSYVSNDPLNHTDPSGECEVRTGSRICEPTATVQITERSGDEIKVHEIVYAKKDGFIFRSYVRFSEGIGEAHFDVAIAGLARLAISAGRLAFGSSAGVRTEIGFVVGISSGKASFSAAENAGLKHLFGLEVSGARNFLSRVISGQIKSLPSGVTRETLERYIINTVITGEKSFNAPSQRLRIQGIIKLLERVPR